MRSFFSAAAAFLLLHSASVQAATTADQTALHRRHDYKQSFKRPYYFNGTIPFFDYYQNVVTANEFVRLSPAVKGLRGAIWCKEPNKHNEWEVELSFNVFGRGAQGSNGLAFWYTRGKGKMGAVYGNGDKWDGLMVAFDTYDPTGERNNPFVLGVLNDGSLEYLNEKKPSSKAFDSCFRGFRNTKLPVWVKISYYDNTIKVAVDLGGYGTEYLDCFKTEGVKLPTGYYFGVSASTGPYEDDHDVFSLETYEVHSNKFKVGSEPKISTKARKKMEKAEREVKRMREEGRKKQRKSTERSRSESSGGGGRPTLSDELIKQIKETQLRIIDSLDTIHRNVGTTAESVLGSSGDLKKTANSAHITEKSITQLKEAIGLLYDDLHKLVGDNGIGKDIRDLQQAIRTLEFKLDGMMGHSNTLHEETRASIHAKTAETQSSVITYVFFIVLGQVLLYVLWNIYRVTKKQDRKFI